MSRQATLPPDDTPTADGIRAAGWWHEAEPDRQTGQAQPREPRIVCDLCPRACALADGQRGFCFVRRNLGGRMVSTTYGRSTGFCVDPIEKKPLYHFYPGSAVLSFGTAGCNLGCRFCQNWTTTRSRSVEASCEAAAPEAVAEAARCLDCRSVAFTYNDPIVWAEYAMDTARACRAAGVATVAVTSGYIAPPARAAFFEAIDAANVDLKGFTEEFYASYCAGHIEPVLDTLRWLARESDVWLEITNLVIPRANDSADELRRMCDWIVAELGAEVPLHFSAFHPDFKLTDRPPTPLAKLVEAHDIARAAGLRYVYTGNVADPRRQHTYCPACRRVVIERDGYRVGEYDVRDGRCGACGAAIAGRFDDEAGHWGGRRLPVRMDAFHAPSPPASVPGDARASGASCGAATPFEAASDEPQSAAPPEFTPDDEQRLLHAAARTVAATVLGRRAEPIEPLLGDAAGVPVYGAFVTLRRRGQLRACCGYLGESLPLGEAISKAAVRSAKDDPRFPPITADELPHLDVDVWVLWGPEEIRASGRRRAGEVVIGKHGLQICRGSSRGLLLPGVAVDHGLDAEGFLRQVCLKAALPPDAWLDDDATLHRFEGRAIHGRLEAALRQHGLPDGRRQEASARPPAVAAAFYPGTPAEIGRALDELLAEGEPLAPEPWAGAMVPHAGWVYSGRLAARVFRRIVVPEQVVILCPKHRPGGAEWAVAPNGVWQWPGGQIESDLDLAGRLTQAVAGLEFDAAAHRDEHAVEVQLPILARVAPRCRVVGIAVGAGPLEALLEFGAQMADVLRPMPRRPLLVVSSDMSHFLAEAAARRLDRLALDAIETLDPARLHDTVRGRRISMCGVSPCVIVMETLRRLDALHRCELAGYTTSAESSGDTRRVVGYAGMLFG